MKINKLCLACGSRNISFHTILNSPILTTDMRKIKKVKLHKATCNACGLMFTLKPGKVYKSISYKNYNLSRTDDQWISNHRQNRIYAEVLENVISKNLNRRKNIKMIEFGSGDGSLAMSLKKINNSIQSFECVDPGDYKLNIPNILYYKTDFLNFLETRKEYYYSDFIYLVNVIEHLPNPYELFKVCHKLLNNNGILCLIAPNGDIASRELVFLDHLYSYTTKSLSSIAAKEKFNLIDTSVVKNFQTEKFWIFSKEIPKINFNKKYQNRLYQKREKIITSTTKLKKKIIRHIRNNSELLCFGTGETAHLILNYAPKIFDKINFFILSKKYIVKNNFKGKRVIPLESFTINKNKRYDIILATNAAIEDRISLLIRGRSLNLKNLNLIKGSKLL